MRGSANMDAYLQTLSQKCFMGPHRDLSQSSDQAIWPRPGFRQAPVHTRCLCCDTLDFVWLKTIRFPTDDFERFCQQYALDRTSTPRCYVYAFPQKYLPSSQTKTKWPWGLKHWDFRHYGEIQTGRLDLLAGSAFNYLSLNSEYAHSREAVKMKRMSLYELLNATKNRAFVCSCT